MVKPLAHCKCMYVCPFTNEEGLKCICVDFKGILNGPNFILIDLLVGDLLSINKVSSKPEPTIVSLLASTNSYHDVLA